MMRSMPVIDDHTINDHIRSIMHQRTAISELARKYGLEDNQKIERLSYLTVPNMLGQYKGPDALISVEKKDRVKEFHEKTQ